MFVCPFETEICGGQIEYHLSQLGDYTSVQSRKLTTNKICFYTINGPGQAQIGDNVILEVKSMRNVEANLVIGTSFVTQEQKLKVFK